ncbi:MAG TPA: FHA domain-containing protein [Micromonosporaceae bacterium]|nr:FHA domain-containing protein [Micromonosporaceae bacterium]
MRFDVTQVLDAIERHLTTEVALAQVVVDLGQIAWFDALDGGRPVNLLRAGLLIDALGRHLGEDAVMLYAVAGRDLLTDADLTSKERMVLGRWASDGLIEVVPVVADRVAEVADITGWPVVTLDGFPGLEGRYPWLREQPERVLRFLPGEGGARIHGGVPAASPAHGPGQGLLSVVWRCPRRECPSFGERRAVSQAVPRMRAGVPVCPRHDEPLHNVGAKAPYVTMVLVVHGAVRERFVVRMGRTVTVGRAPEDPHGIAIAGHLSGEIAAMISRNHVHLDLREDGMYVTDVSTNGTVVRSPSSPYGGADQIHLTGGAPYHIKPWDTIELYDGVIICRADQSLLRGSGGGYSSVMGDAPTISMPQI